MTEVVSPPSGDTSVPSGGGERGRNMKADEINNYAYNKKLQPFANRLCKEMTKAEACLWKYVLRHIETVRESIAFFVQKIEQSTPLIPRQRGTTKQEP